MSTGNGSPRESNSNDPVFTSDGKQYRSVMWNEDNTFTYLQIRGVRLKDGRVWREGPDDSIHLCPDGVNTVHGDSTCFYEWDEIAAVLL